MVKNPPANTEDARDMGLIPGLGRSPGVGNGNPLQYPHLGNPMVGRAWRATVHGVAKSQTGLSTSHVLAIPYQFANDRIVLKSGPGNLDLARRPIYICFALEFSE